MPDQRAKDPAAVALGRKGGRKGGPARAAKLDRERLSEIGRLGGLATALARSRARTLTHDTPAEPAPESDPTCESS